MTNERQNIDAAFCGTIPLHQTNLLQPHGVLLVINKQDLKIIQVSANAGPMFGCESTELVERPLSDIIEEAGYTAIKTKFESQVLNIGLPFFISLKHDTGPVSALVLGHEKDGCLYLEIEFSDLAMQQEKNFDLLFHQVQQVMSAVNLATSVQEVTTIAASELKKLTQFDKIMIYSFDEEWNGTVIAEEMEIEMETYLGLKFPASDVPKQARDLYLKNPYRIIPDREYKPIGLIPETNPLTNSFTNLSGCKLRSVVPVHLEYLKNMNVMASMSVRIIHQEQLWGLIACHHRTPKFLSFLECTLMEFLSTAISSKIASLLYLSFTKREEQLLSYYTSLVQDLQMSDDIVTALLRQPEALLGVLSAEGVAICWDQNITLVGTTPDSEKIRGLCDWLKEKGFSNLIHLPTLSHQYEKAKEYADTASGLLALPIQPYEGNYILAFRPEKIKYVTWGGNPNEVITFEKDNVTYHPRNSFKIWKETVSYTADPWAKVELEISERLRTKLVEHTLRKLTKSLEVKVYDRTKELEQTNNELMQFIHVTSHDLQEPARKIQVFSNLLKNFVDAEEGKINIQRLLLAGGRISALIKNLVNYSRLSTEGPKVRTDLNNVVSEVLSDLELIIEERKARISSQSLPAILAVPDQMRQVFHNLISNALKFNKADPQIDILVVYTTALDFDAPTSENGNYCKITVKDNGLGFNVSYTGKMFELFKKFHFDKEYEGVGVGLAITKKIIVKHGGIIKATGKENEGAEFTFLLPI